MEPHGAAGSEPAAARALRDLLGLAARARALVSGTDMTRHGLRKGSVRVVLVAADASPTQSRKVLPLARARGVPCHTCLSREEIGAATGRPPASAVGITQDGFARRAAELAAELSSLQD